MIESLKEKVMDKWNAMSPKLKIVVAAVIVVIIISIIK